MFTWFFFSIQPTLQKKNVYRTINTYSDSLFIDAFYIFFYPYSYFYNIANEWDDTGNSQIINRAWFSACAIHITYTYNFRGAI